MPAGLQVINDAGDFQIDETYRNLKFIEKFVFSTAGDHTFTTSAGRVAPLLVLYSTSASPIPTAGILMVQSTKNVGNSWTYRVNGIGECYIFDVPPVIPTHGVGLVVYNASGQAVFDSNIIPMKVGIARYWGGWGGSIGNEFYAKPTQTLSTAPESFFRSIVEDTSSGSYPAYAKPAAEKWGWLQCGAIVVQNFTNTPAGGGPSSGPYGAGDGNNHKGVGAIHAVGNNFVVTFRDIKPTGAYYTGPYDWRCVIVMVNITGL